MPVIRIEGKEFIEGYPTLGADELVAGNMLRRESRSDLTRVAELALGFPPSLYFYVGYSNSSFGDAVFVYRPERFDRDAGRAAPFDTGGFHYGKFTFPGVRSPWRKRLFVWRRSVRLGVWRRAFSAYIVTYFDSVRRYIDDRPNANHPQHAAHDARAWVWELRLYRDHPVMDGLKYAYLGHDYAEHVRERLRAAPPTDSTVWWRRFQDRILRGVELGQSPHDAVTAAIAEELS